MYIFTRSKGGKRLGYILMNHPIAQIREQENSSTRTHPQELSWLNNEFQTTARRQNQVGKREHNNKRKEKVTENASSSVGAYNFPRQQKHERNKDSNRKRTHVESCRSQRNSQEKTNNTQAKQISAAANDDDAEPSTAGTAATSLALVHDEVVQETEPHSCNQRRQHDSSIKERQHQPTTDSTDKKSANKSRHTFST